MLLKSEAPLEAKLSHQKDDTYCITHDKKHPQFPPPMGKFTLTQQPPRSKCIR